MVKVQIGLTTYPRKADVEARVRAILHGYGIGIPIPGEDDEFLRGFIERHPDRANLIGSGISHFVISDDHTDWASRPRAFVVVRKDGTRSRTFSYKTCVRGGYTAPRSRLLAAMRAVVAADVQAGRDAYFAAYADADNLVACQLTGLRVPIPGIEAHHDPIPFVALADEFFASRGITEVTEVMTRNADVGWEFADLNLAASWRAFHQARAQFLYVSIEAHRGVAAASALSFGG